MEFSFATFVPAIVLTVVLALAIYSIRTIYSLSMRTIGWMVLNGYWFPKIMRAQRDAHVVEMENNIAELNKIINGRND